MAEGKPTIGFDEKKVDAIFAEFDQCHLPGVAVGIAVGGRPVYRKGYGLSSIEVPTVLTPSTRMRVCSITKHFTALACMLLCEDGAAEIDDPIGKFLPELHPVTHRVTLRQLMGNIGGLRDANDISFRFSGTEAFVSSADILSLYRDMDDVNAAPGAAYIYSNGGWLMLSAVIERITKQMLEDVLRERIFAPLGMYDTMLRRHDCNFVSNSATLHMNGRAGGFEKFCMGAASAGEGGVISTIDDMLRWLAHMDKPVIGTATTWETMKAPQSLANGTSTAYGLGLISGEYRGLKILFHPGSWFGGNAQMLKAPQIGFDVVVLVNRHDLWAMLFAEKILDACLPDLVSVSRSPAGFPRSEGLFRSPTTGRVIQLCTFSPLSWNKGAQQIASIDGIDMPVEPDHEGVLRPPGSQGDFVRLAITLRGDDPATPTSLRFDHVGSLDELVAVNPIEKGNRQHAIFGRFRSDTTGTEATIVATDDGPRLTTVGRFGSMVYHLDCLAEGIWRTRPSRLATPPGGILSFSDDGTEFRFSSWQTWALPFKRCA